jgi:NDP-sugar pyrophosphorylase family protein
MSIDASDLTAVILAGGQGTRLRPFTTSLPKPLVPLGERSIIEILLTRLHRCGVRDVHMAVNHLAHLIMAVLGDGTRFGLKLRYSIEESALSTVGPLTLIDNLPEHFIVCNGDVITDLDFRAIYDQHLASGSLLTVGTVERKDIIDYGVLQVDLSGQVTSFEEKPVVSYLVSMGVYVFSRQVLELVARGERYGFDDLMRLMLARKCPINTFPYAGYWLDIGRPADYERALADLVRIESFLA